MPYAYAFDAARASGCLVSMEWMETRHFSLSAIGPTIIPPIPISAPGQRSGRDEPTGEFMSRTTSNLAALLAVAGGLAMAAPAAAQTKNPCSPVSASSPCAANPCAAKANPCAANPCAAKANPCAANPCSAKGNPCAANPCSAKRKKKPN